MSDELSEFKARLEALAAGWARNRAPEDVTSGWDEGYSDACQEHVVELRALLAPVAAPSAPVPPKCEECEYQAYTACVHPDEKDTWQMHARATGNCGPTGRLFKMRGTP